MQDILALLGAGTSEADLRLSYGFTADEVRACFEYASSLVAERMMQRSDPGSKTHAGDRQLEGAFWRHREAGHAGVAESDSCLLLLIYAIASSRSCGHPQKRSGSSRGSSSAPRST